MSTRQHRAGKIIAVGGGKGGIGKTVVSASLAIALAEAQKEVVVIDGDLGGANLHAVFGIYLPRLTLYDFYSRKVNRLSDLVLDTPIPGVRVICGAPGTPGMANIRYWEKLKTLRHLNYLDADFVIVDLGAGMSYNEIDFFNSADIGIVVASPEPTSIHECYNFIKMALFRKLHRAFMDEPDVMDILRRSADPMHLHDRRLMSQIAEEIRSRNLRAGIRFYKLLNHTSPKLILNKLHHYQEYQDGLSLQVAVQELLRIKVEYWGYLPYSPHVPQAIRERRPDQILRSDTQLRKHVVKIVQKFLLQRPVAYHAPGARPIVPITDVQSAARAHPSVLEREERICSIHCPLWGNCHYQEGGLPCRMPLKEYETRVLGRQSSPPKNVDSMDLPENSVSNDG